MVSVRIRDAIERPLIQMSAETLQVKRWAIYIDIEGASKIYPHNHVQFFRAVDALFDAVCRIGSRVCPEEYQQQKSRMTPRQESQWSSRTSPPPSKCAPATWDVTVSSVLRHVNRLRAIFS